MYLKEFISGKRKKFLRPFDRILTIKLQRLGVNCWLKCSNNWFAKKDGKKSKKFWSGRFNCYEKLCELNYEAVIQEWHAFED